MFLSDAENVCVDRVSTDDIFNNRDRFLNMSDKVLPEQLVHFLGKGPIFALSRSVNKHILKDVEIGLERGAFALRWRECIENKKADAGQLSSSSDERCSEPDGPVSLPLADSLDSDLELAQDNLRKVTLNPRFSDTDTKAAPTAGASTEQTLKVLKRKVMTLYKNYKSTSHHNHQPSDVSMLKKLNKDPDVIVKRSDKCKGLVVLSKDEYAHKAEAITHGYQAIQKKTLLN